MASSPLLDDRIARTYEALRALIVRGQLAPGTRIMEADIAERLGVSRTPVRSALQRLRQEGYIVHSTGRRRLRAVVRPLTWSDAADLLGIVGELEGLSGRRAAGLGDGVRRRVVSELRRINESLLSSVNLPPSERPRILDLDSTFHRTFVKAGGGARLLALHDAIKPQAERYVRLYVGVLLDRVEASVGEHAAIVDAIEAGDADAAQHALQSRWREAALRLAPVIEGAGERGSWKNPLRSQGGAGP